MIYYSNINIKPLGDAIVVDLSESCLPTIRPSPHCTLLWRSGGFNGDKIREVIRYRDIEWEQYIPLQFSLIPWGKESDEVIGELADFVYSVRYFFSDRWMCMQRSNIAHVRLR